MRLCGQTLIFIDIQTNKKTMDEKNVYSQILESLANSYNNFVETFKKHGILICTVIMVLFILFWTLIINPINVNEIIQKRLQMQYEQMQQQETQLKEELIDRRYRANEVIGGLMSDIQKQYGCSRVLLLEKHNSLKTLGNVDFLYLSASIELIDTDNQQVNYISDDLQRQVVFNLLGSETITRLRHSNYLFYDDLQNEKRSECRLINKLIAAGDKQCILYPFRDNKHRPLLIVVISGDNLNVSEIVGYLNENRAQVKDLLIFD